MEKSTYFSWYYISLNIYHILYIIQYRSHLFLKYCCIFQGKKKKQFKSKYFNLQIITGVKWITFSFQLLKLCWQSEKSPCQGNNCPVFQVLPTVVLSFGGTTLYRRKQRDHIPSQLPWLVTVNHLGLGQWSPGSWMDCLGGKPWPVINLILLVATL